MASKNIIDWNILRIIIPFNSGQLTEKKIASIVNSFKEKGLQINVSLNASANAVIFMFEDGITNLVVTEQQLMMINVINKEIDHERIKNILKLVFEVLLVDDKNKFVFNMEGYSIASDSQASSREFYSDKIEKLDDDVYGVGYRFLIRNSEFDGEFKVEPNIQDSKRYYFQLILNRLSECTIDEVFAYFMEECNRDYNKYLISIKG